MSEFDSNDIEALRRMKDAQSASNERKDGRRLRSHPGRAIRDVQLNARVRREIKDLAYELAKARRSTIADVIELAIELLHERETKNGNGRAE